MIAIDCTCGQHLRLADDLAGKKLRCPHCGDVVTVAAVAPKRHRGPSPVLLLTGPAIEERIWQEQAQAAEAECWQGPLKYFLAGVMGMGMAAASYWVLPYPINKVAPFLFGAVALCCWGVALLQLIGSPFAFDSRDH